MHMKFCMLFGSRWFCIVVQLPVFLPVSCCRGMHYNEQMIHPCSNQHPGGLRPFSIVLTHNMIFFLPSILVFHFINIIFTHARVYGTSPVFTLSCATVSSFSSLSSKLALHSSQGSSTIKGQCRWSQRLHTKATSSSSGLFVLASIARDQWLFLCDTLHLSRIPFTFSIVQSHLLRPGKMTRMHRASRWPTAISCFISWLPLHSMQRVRYMVVAIPVSDFSSF